MYKKSVKKDNTVHESNVCLTEIPGLISNWLWIIVLYPNSVTKKTFRHLSRVVLFSMMKHTSILEVMSYYRYGKRK